MTPTGFALNLHLIGTKKVLFGAIYDAFNVAN